MRTTPTVVDSRLASKWATSSPTLSRLTLKTTAAVVAAVYTKPARILCSSLVERIDRRVSFGSGSSGPVGILTNRIVFVRLLDHRDPH